MLFVSVLEISHTPSSLKKYYLRQQVHYYAEHNKYSGRMDN